MLVFVKKLCILKAGLSWLSRLILLFPFVAVISNLELRSKLALNLVSLQNILAIVIRAAEFAFEGPIAKKIL